LTFRTYYYVNRPSGVGGGKPYSLNFSMDPYNPLGAYFTLQAQKLVTQVAVLSHLRIISKSLQSLGALYLDLDILNQLAANQKELVQVARENLAYVENRLSIGTATSLEVTMARQQLELAMGEQEGIALSQKRDLNGLKSFLGMQSYRISPSTTGTAGVKCWAISIRPPLPWSKPRTALTNSRPSSCINNSRPTISAWPLPRFFPPFYSTPRPRHGVTTGVASMSA
jgi:hypothetical protein